MLSADCYDCQLKPEAESNKKKQKKQDELLVPAGSC